MSYQIVSANEWLYTDSLVDEQGPKNIALSAARGSYAACQILWNGVHHDAPISFSYTGDSGYDGLANPEVYQLIDILVEKNTGPVSFCVKEGESAEAYTTRQAPFRLYEALKPLDEKTRSRARTEALYVCWTIPEDVRPGVFGGHLTVTIGEQSYRIPVETEVFPAVVPAKETLSVTNWYVLGFMADRYGLEKWSEEHWSIIRQYGELMRRARQTHFWVPMEAFDIEETEPGTYRIGFDNAERLINMYLELGFSGIEGGLVAGRDDFWGPEFVVKIGGKSVRALSKEGYAYLSQFLTAWRTFLEERGWIKLLIQHVADEPTEVSKDEYRMLSGIVRKFMPGVPLIEAVETHDLAGAVDILVPKNSYYQEHRDEFEKLRSTGDKLWFYTCCFPGGHYMNRLWDMPLLRTRYLHWGNYIYRLDGFLHWGFNWIDNDKDPFNHTDLLFPPGDTHITYPGPDGPWGSMRLEAMRAGIEDYELLTQLAHSNRALADEIAASCVTRFDLMNENPADFAEANRRLLQAVSEAKSG